MKGPLTLIYYMAYILIIGTFTLGLVCNMEWDNFFQGNASFKEKDFKKAISHYSDAIRMDGNNATYYNNRAMAYLQLCRWFLLHAEISNYFMQVSWVLSYLKRGLLNCSSHESFFWQLSRGRSWLYEGSWAGQEGQLTFLYIFIFVLFCFQLGLQKVKRFSSS